MEQKPVVIEKRGEIGFLILNQPARGNMLSQALFDGIIEALEELNVDNEIGLIIVKNIQYLKFAK